MTLLSFSVLREKLESREKLQTIRKLLEVQDPEYILKDIQRALKTYARRPGARLHFWWGNPRNKRTNPACAPMGEGWSTGCQPVWILPGGITAVTARFSMVELGKHQTEAIARADGFNSYAEMYEWFAAHYFKQVQPERVVFTIIYFAWDTDHVGGIPWFRCNKCGHELATEPTVRLHVEQMHGTRVDSIASWVTPLPYQQTLGAFIKP